MGWECPRGQTGDQTEMGQGGARRPPPRDQRTVVTRSRSRGPCLLKAFLLSCCVTLSSVLPLSGPASLQERPSYAQEMPAWGFCWPETLQPLGTGLSREVPSSPGPPPPNSPASQFSGLEGHLWGRCCTTAAQGPFPAGGKPQGSVCKQEVRAGAEG